MKFSMKPIPHYPLHLKHVATLPREIKHSNFLQLLSKYESKYKQVALTAPILISLHVQLSVIMHFYQNLVLVAECHVNCWETVLWRLLWQISSTTDWSHKQVKEQWHGNFYLQSVWRKTRYYKHWKYRNLWMNKRQKW